MNTWIISFYCKYQTSYKIHSIIPFWYQSQYTFFCIAYQQILSWEFLFNFLVNSFKWWFDSAFLHFIGWTDDLLFVDLFVVSCFVFYILCSYSIILQDVVLTTHSVCMLPGFRDTMVNKIQSLLPRCPQHFHIRNILYGAEHWLKPSGRRVQSSAIY